MKKVLLVMAAALVMIGCGNKKVAPTKGEVEVLVPCKEFKTDKNTLRANGNAISPNMQNATDKAMQAARRELATSIEATVQRVLEDFSSSYDLDNQADFRARTKDLTRTVVNQKLQGSVAVCDKVTRTTEKDGSVMYHAYVAVELTSNELMESLLNNTKKAISDSEKLRTDFEYEQFKKTFEAEMEKLAGAQQ